MNKESCIAKNKKKIAKKIHARSTYYRYIFNIFSISVCICTVSDKIVIFAKREWIYISLNDSILNFKFIKFKSNRQLD